MITVSPEQPKPIRWRDGNAISIRGFNLSIMEPDDHCLL